MDVKPDLWKSPAVHPLSVDNVRELADSLNLKCSEEELNAYSGHIRKLSESYQRINELVEPALPVKYPRTPGYRPTPDENSLNAWYYKCDIKGASSGKLSGKRVGIKDNTAVAGVPMMNGSKILEGYVPEYDATIVTRILDEGGIIVGKTTCDDLCFSGAGFVSSTGQVYNPLQKGHIPGGSSSGSAALVAAGEIDMATGADQGASIRIPSSWCGIVGLKPTFGLVPYTGCLSMDMSIDHCGPMTANVRDCALMLEVMAGYDQGRDPRQPRDYVVPKYSQLLSDDLEGKRVALLKEGFDNCEPDVMKMVKGAAYSLEQKGALVEEVSLPAHTDGFHIWIGVEVEGTYRTLVGNKGPSPGWKGQYLTSALDKFAQGYLTRPSDFSEVIAPAIIMGKYLTDSYHGRFYAKSQNLVQYLCKEYDKLLEKYDVLIMPTAPYKAPKLPKASSTVSERLHTALGMFQNTAPFDVTGHPSLSINVGQSNGLPVGMMITGRNFDDVTVLQVANVHEILRDGA